MKKNMFRETKGAWVRVPSAAHFGKDSGLKEAAKSKPEYSWVLARSGTGRILLLEPAQASETRAAENRMKGLDALLDAALGFMEYGMFEKAREDVQLVAGNVRPGEARLFSEKLRKILVWDDSGLGQEGTAGLDAVRTVAAGLLPRRHAF